jgi:hypothetical protein
MDVSAATAARNFLRPQSPPDETLYGKRSSRSSSRISGGGSPAADAPSPPPTTNDREPEVKPVPKPAPTEPHGLVGRLNVLYTDGTLVPEWHVLAKQNAPGPLDSGKTVPTWRVCANGSRYTGQAYHRDANGQFIPTGMSYRDGTPTMKAPLQKRMKNAFTVSAVLLAICVAGLAIYLGFITLLIHLH